jgi:hypothetical protein
MASPDTADIRIAEDVFSSRRRVERSDRACGGGTRDRSHRQRKVRGGIELGQHKGLDARAARHDALDRELQHRWVAFRRALDQFSHQRLGLAIEQRLRELRRGIARAERPLGRIARDPAGKPPAIVAAAPAAALFLLEIYWHR